MKGFPPICLLVILSLTTSAQPVSKNHADSLLQLLAREKTGISSMYILIELARYHILKPGERQIDFDSASTYLSEARRLNESIKSPSIAGRAHLTESLMLKEKGQKNTAIAKVEEAVRVLELSHDKYYLGKALYELSGYYGYEDSADYSKKVNLVERSVAALQETSGIQEKADALKMLGDLYSINGKYEEALGVLKQSLDAYNSIQHKPLQGVYYLIGSIYRLQNDYKQAMLYTLLALKTAENCQDSSIQRCEIHSSLAALYTLSAHYETTLKHLKDALKTAIKCDDRFAIALTVYNICVAYIMLEQPEASLNFLATLPPDLRQPTGTIQRALLAMSYLDTYLSLRNYSKAAYYCGAALTMVDDKAVSSGFKSIIYRLAAFYYFGIKEYSKARFYISKNIPISKTFVGPKAFSLDERLRYKLDSAESNYQSAFRHLLTYKTISDSLFNVTKARQFLQLEVEHETTLKQDSLKQKDLHISLLLQRNKLQQSNLKQSNLIRNITAAGTAFILVALALLYHQFMKNKKKSRIILQKNEELEQMLAEKEWWLKEVHHRVKNNLHTIICLLESQAMYLEKDALQAIEKSQHRIYAMSLIHQKLYQNEDLQVIDMSIYLDEFIGYLKDSFDTQKIDFVMQVDPVHLNLQQAIPVALIINEAVTNSIKYAFDEESEPKIYVSMTETSGAVKFTIMDNGRGFEMKAEDEGKSLGMQLIKGLSKELKGIIRIDSKGGTKLSVEFKKGPLTDQMAYAESENIVQ